MAILNFASRRSRQRPIFLVTDRGETVSKETQEHPYLKRTHSRRYTVFMLQQEGRKPLLKMGARRAGFKRASTPRGESAGAFSALRINVKRASFTFHDLGTDDHLLNPIEARQVKHRIQQNAFHD
jgi:hypothetical protein